MAENDSKAPPPSNQTIQVDALSDVELLDQSAEGDAGVPFQVSAPPPLPKKPKAPSSAGRIAGFLVVVLLTGALGAVGAHFLAPQAPAPAPVAAPVPPPAEVPTPADEPEVNHIVLDDEFVIRAADPDAGLASPE